MSWISYAQNYEDVVLARAFAGIDDGFYVDVGAQHPRIDSVTKAFYDRGWRGINIEPSPAWHAMLVEARPRDINLCVAAGSAEGEVIFHEVLDSGLSTSVEAYAERHRAAGRAVVSSRVSMRPLDAIFAEHGVTRVHFLKVDVEGAEADVLRGLGLERVRPRVMLVEANEPNSQVRNHAQWEHLLLDHGYSFALDDGLNRFYVANEHAVLIPALQLPPNFFDGFVRREVVDQVDGMTRHIEQADKLLRERAVQIESLDNVLANERGAREQAEQNAQSRCSLLQDAVTAEHDLSQKRLAALDVAASRDQVLTARIAQAEQDAAVQARRQSELEAELRRMERVAAASALRIEVGERSVATLSKLMVDTQAAQRESEHALVESRAAHERSQLRSADLQLELDRNTRSMSWKLTAPLRAANAARRQLLAVGDAGARGLARSPFVRRLAARLLRPFPTAAASIKRRLYGPAPASPEPRMAASVQPITQDAMRILALYPRGSLPHDLSGPPS